MALETLMGIKEINGESVLDIDETRKIYSDTMVVGERQDGVNFNLESFDQYYKRVWEPKSFIRVDHNSNTISFKIQQGPIKENGKNGCQVEDMIAVAQHIVQELHNKHPSKYNEDIIRNLELAIQASKQRTADRERRQVEGTSQL